MITTTETKRAEFVKPAVLVDEPVTITAGDFRDDGKFGPEIVYNIRRADGSDARLSLGRRRFRELGLQRIWTALEDHPEGVPAVLRKLEPERDGTEFEVYLWSPFESGKQPSRERVAWERSRAGSTRQDPRLGPEHRSWLRDQAANDAVPDAAFADDEFDDPDDE
jgi:hypothetical protein